MMSEKSQSGLPRGRNGRPSEPRKPEEKPRQQIDSTFSTTVDRAFESEGKGLRTRHPDAGDPEHIWRNREEPK